MGCNRRGNRSSHNKQLTTRPGANYKLNRSHWHKGFYLVVVMPPSMLDHVKHWSLVVMTHSKLPSVGLVVKVDWLVGLYSETDKTVVLAVYSATVTGGELIAGEETLETATFPYEKLPELAFNDDTKIVQDWLDGRAKR